MINTVLKPLYASTVIIWKRWHINFFPVVRQIKSIFHQNTSLCEASTKIGTNAHHGLLFEKSPLATSIFKMAAIYSRWPPIILRSLYFYCIWLSISCICTKLHKLIHLNTFLLKNAIEKLNFQNGRQYFWNYIFLVN